MSSESARKIEQDGANIILFWCEHFKEDMEELAQVMQRVQCAMEAKICDAEEERNTDPYVFSLQTVMQVLTEAFEQSAQDYAYWIERANEHLERSAQDD